MNTSTNTNQGSDANDVNASLASDKEVLDIVYQDDALVAINKPAGLLVHRSPIDRHETRFALQLVRDQIGQRVYPVHRLDKPTSGLLLFALSPELAKRVSQQFSERATEKQYLAIVRGVPEAQGCIDHALAEQLDKLADADAIKALAAAGEASHEKAAQPAITHYRRLATVELPFAVGRYATSRYSLVALEPKTGRKHQLRRHMKHVFHPIIGDTTHGEGRHNRFFRQQYGCHRLLLAATSLQLNHPITGEVLTLRADPGPEFMQLLDTFGWHFNPLS